MHRYGPKLPATPGGFPCPPGNSKRCESSPDTLPPDYQYLGDEVTGGVNEAMDYAPVYVTKLGVLGVVFGCMYVLALGSF